MINTRFVTEKLDLVKMYYQEMQKILDVSLEEVKKDFIRFYALERVFQLIVDEVIDINNHIIRSQDFGAPDNFQSTFTILAENEVLPEEFAEKIAPVVGLRNRLVHRYEKIDKKLFLEMAIKEKEDLKEYVKFIKSYLREI